MLVDTETTSLEGRIIELSWLDMTNNSKIQTRRYQTTEEISTGAMAVHHITPEMIKDCPTFKESPEHQLFKDYVENDHILVAHNTPFDAGMLKKERIVFKRSIDTLQVAKHILSESMSYSLQFLRYHLKLYQDEKEEIFAHSASGDVMVLQKLFEYLHHKIMEDNGLTPSQTIDRMIELSLKPVLLLKMNFGKYRGEHLRDIKHKNPSYYKWLTAIANDPNLIFSIKYWNEH